MGTALTMGEGKQQRRGIYVCPKWRSPVTKLPSGRGGAWPVRVVESRLPGTIRASGGLLQAAPERRPPPAWDHIVGLLTTCHGLPNLEGRHQALDGWDRAPQQQHLAHIWQPFQQLGLADSSAATRFHGIPTSGFGDADPTVLPRTDMSMAGLHHMAFPGYPADPGGSGLTAGDLTDMATSTAWPQDIQVNTDDNDGTNETSQQQADNQKQQRPWMIEDDLLLEDGGFFDASQWELDPLNEGAILFGGGGVDPTLLFWPPPAAPEPLSTAPPPAHGQLGYDVSGRTGGMSGPAAAAAAPLQPGFSPRQQQQEGHDSGKRGEQQQQQQQQQPPITAAQQSSSSLGRDVAPASFTPSWSAPVFVHPLVQQRQQQQQQHQQHQQPITFDESLQTGREAKPVASTLSENTGGLGAAQQQQLRRQQLEALAILQRFPIPLGGMAQSDPQAQLSPLGLGGENTDNNNGNNTFGRPSLPPSSPRFNAPPAGRPFQYPLFPTTSPQLPPLSGFSLGDVEVAMSLPAVGDDGMHTDPSGGGGDASSPWARYRQIGPPVIDAPTHQRSSSGHVGSPLDMLVPRDAVDAFGEGELAISSDSSCHPDSGDEARPFSPGGGLYTSSPPAAASLDGAVAANPNPSAAAPHHARHASLDQTTTAASRRTLRLKRPATRQLRGPAPVRRNTTSPTPAAAVHRRRERPLRQEPPERTQLPVSSQARRLRASARPGPRRQSVLGSGDDDGEDEEDDDGETDVRRGSTKQKKPRPVPPPPDSDRRLLDKYLVEARLWGLGYKQIREEGGFAEAESTLRGRYRTLTKPRENRRRKPDWNEKNDALLLDAVYKLAGITGGAVAGRGSSTRGAVKVPWKQVSEYVLRHGGPDGYSYGFATCRKRWDFLVGRRGRNVESRMRRGEEEDDDDEQEDDDDDDDDYDEEMVDG